MNLMKDRSARWLPVNEMAMTWMAERLDDTHVTVPDLFPELTQHGAAMVLIKAQEINRSRLHSRLMIRAIHYR